MSAADSPETRTVYRFADLALSLTRRELSRNGSPISLAPKAFDLLVYLARNRGRVVDKEELVRSVWCGLRLSGGAVAQCVWTVRAAIERAGGCKQIIATVPRCGYRFVAPITEDAGPHVTRSPSLPASFAASLIGRSEELERLETFLPRLADSQIRLLFIDGWPGIGKTEVAERACSIAAARGFRVLKARCASGDAPPLWPCRQLLRAAECQLPYGTSIPETMECILEAVLKECREAPVALFVEDLHAADSATLAFLGTFLTFARESGTTLIATARSAPAPSNRIGAWLAAFSSDVMVEHLTLRGLKPAHGARLAGSLLPPARAECEAQQIHRYAGGFPLFIKETCRALSTLSKREWDPLPMSPRILDLLQHELGQLPHDTLELLRAAAALDDGFTIDDLREIAPRASSLTITCQRALDCDLLERCDIGRRVRFRCGLIREFIRRHYVVERHERKHDRRNDVAASAQVAMMES
jgi:DNA-binding winged helix-turn-helix (wHTH) protein